MIASSANDDIFFEPILDIKEDAKFIDSKAIDTALPVSQIQDTLLSRHGSVVTRWINKKIVFPGSKSDLSWINTARNAVAAHNPILRTAIYHDRLAGKYVQTVLQSSRSLDARDGAIECTEPPAFSPLLYNQIPHSALQYDDQKSIYILTVWYPHIPLDDFSFVLIEDDLTCFYRVCPSESVPRFVHIWRMLRSRTTTRKALVIGVLLTLMPSHRSCHIALHEQTEILIARRSSSNVTKASSMVSTS
jgi:hypothetical protein